MGFSVLSGFGIINVFLRLNVDIHNHMTAQTCQAKQAWKEFDRAGRSIFHFKEYPAVVDFVKTAIPPRTRVALFGGGRGAIAELLAIPRCSFVTIDIADISSPYVAHLRADIELQLSRETIGLDGKDRLHTTSLFSLEYLDIAQVVKNVTAILREHERWVVVCHHSDSFILKSFGEVPALLDILELLLPAVEVRENSIWKTALEEAEKRVRYYFPHLIPGDISLVKTSTIKMRRLEDDFLLASDHSRAARIGQHLIHFRYAIEETEKMGMVQTRIWEFYRKSKLERAISENLLNKSLREPGDLDMFFCGRFDSVNSETFLDNHGKPLAIGVVYKKR